MSEARSGRRVLVASLDQAHSLGDALGFRFPHDPGTVAGVATVLPGLDVIEMDSLALLEDRFREVVRLISTGHGHDHGIDIAALDPAELTGLPGVQELLMLVEIAEFTAEHDWDLIIVDCPPSADMLRIITAPETLLGYVERIWPPQARAMSAIGTDLRRAVLAATVERNVKAITEVRDLLADHRRTGARLITVAERIAVAESERVRSAAALLGLRLDAVVVNKVLPDAAPPAGPVEAENPAVQWYSNRHREQLDVIAELRRKMLGIPVVIAQHTGPEPIGLSPLAALSYAVDSMRNVGDAALMLSDNQTEVDVGAGEPVVRWESGAGLQSVYALRMHLPVVDAATLRLGRVEDDLIVGADGVRRRVRLAPVLRRCAVDGAELDGGHLVVRFRPDPQVWSHASEGHRHDR